MAGRGHVPRVRARLPGRPGRAVLLARDDRQVPEAHQSGAARARARAARPGRAAQQGKSGRCMQVQVCRITCKHAFFFRISKNFLIFSILGITFVSISRNFVS